jgi:hypothetical protein
MLRANREALKTGEGSQLVASGALAHGTALEAFQAFAERRAEVEAHLGGADAVSALQRGLVPRVVELEAILNYQASELLERGVTTSKGRARAILASYLSTLDRYVRLTTTLGLEPKTRTVNAMSAAQWAAQHGTTQER